MIDCSHLLNWLGLFCDILPCYIVVSAFLAHLLLVFINHWCLPPLPPSLRGIQVMGDGLQHEMAHWNVQVSGYVDREDLFIINFLTYTSCWWLLTTGACRGDMQREVMGYHNFIVWDNWAVFFCFSIISS